MNFEPPRGDDAAVQQWLTTSVRVVPTCTGPCPCCNNHRRRAILKSLDTMDNLPPCVCANHHTSHGNHAEPETTAITTPTATTISCVKISSSWILKLLPYRDHVTHIQLDLRGLSNTDITHLVSILAGSTTAPRTPTSVVPCGAVSHAGPSELLPLQTSIHNTTTSSIRHVKVVLFDDSPSRTDESRKLVHLLQEMNRLKIHHLETFKLQNVYMTEYVTPLLRDIIVRNIHLTTLDIAFDRIELATAYCLWDIFNLAKLRNLCLTVLLPPTTATSTLTNATSYHYQQPQNPWNTCRERCGTAKKHLHTLHLIGHCQFAFLTLLFPNLTCTNLAYNDKFCSTPTHLQQPFAGPTIHPTMVLHPQHPLTQLNLTLRCRFACLTASTATITVLEKLESLTMDVRYVRATDDDIADDLVHLLTHCTCLHTLVLQNRAMSKRHLVRLCSLFHRHPPTIVDGTDHDQTKHPTYPYLHSIHLDIFCPDADEECRKAYLQILVDTPTIEIAHAQFFNNYHHPETFRHAQFLCVANRIQAARLLREYVLDPRHDDGTPLALWAHILAALTLHPSMIFHLCKEKVGLLLTRP